MSSNAFGGGWRLCWRCCDRGRNGKSVVVVLIWASDSECRSFYYRLRDFSLPRQLWDVEVLFSAIMWKLVWKVILTMWQATQWQSILLRSWYVFLNIFDQAQVLHHTPPSEHKDDPHQQNWSHKSVVEWQCHTVCEFFCCNQVPRAVKEVHNRTLADINSYIFQHQVTNILLANLVPTSPGIRVVGLKHKKKQCRLNMVRCKTLLRKQCIIYQD